MIYFSVEGTCGKPGGRGEGGVQKGGEWKDFGRNVLRVGSGRGMQTFVNHQGRYIGGRGIGCCEQNILSPLFYFTSNPTSLPSKSVSRVLLPGDKKLFKIII